MYEQNCSQEYEFGQKFTFANLAKVFQFSFAKWISPSPLAKCEGLCAYLMILHSLMNVIQSMEPHTAPWIPETMKNPPKYNEHQKKAVAPFKGRELKC